MAHRNLTRKFFELRNGAKANRHLNLETRSESDGDGESGLLKAPDSANWKSAKESLPPVWVDNIESVEEVITKIQIKIRELNQLHTKRLMVNFEDDENQQEQAIDTKTREITSLFHDAEQVLKRFSKASDNKDISLAEKTVRKNLQMSMAKKLQGYSTAFRSTQKEYMNRLQAQKSGNGAETFDFLNEKGQKVEAADRGFNQSQIQQVDYTEELVNQRDEEITRIAQSIEELAAIFKELAVLVIDQGTILDRIDYNMETAVEHAKEGIVQLEKAEDHQKSAMSVRCIFALVILIIIMLAILVWKHTK